MLKLTNSDIELIEKELGAPFPNLYRQILASFGFGKFGADFEIYHPMNIRGLYEQFFDDPGQIFRPYFPFGCDNRKQEIWVIDATVERVASIWHETVPEDWFEEDWFSLEEWEGFRLLQKLI